MSRPTKHAFVCVPQTEMHGGMSRHVRLEHLSHPQHAPEAMQVRVPAAGAHHLVEVPQREAVLWPLPHALGVAQPCSAVAVRWPRGVCVWVRTLQAGSIMPFGHTPSHRRHAHAPARHPKCFMASSRTLLASLAVSRVRMNCHAVLCHTVPLDGWMDGGARVSDRIVLFHGFRHTRPSLV